VKVVEVALGLLEREGRWFLQRRDPAGLVLPGLWEFPGGKVEAGESALEACRRELAEEVGLGVLDLTPLLVHTFTYPDRRVRLHPFRVAVTGEPRTPLAWGWFSLGEIAHLPIPPANLPLLERWTAHGVE
jgi:8-oxo-dGTP diphosphatase